MLDCGESEDEVSLLNFNHAIMICPGGLGFSVGAILAGSAGLGFRDPASPGICEPRECYAQNLPKDTF